MARAEGEIRGRLRERHRLEWRNLADDFSIQNQTTVLAAARQTGDSFTLLITGLALISLLVGAVGIMAVMLLTVRERTVEVGLRMAIGSRPRDILLQFLSESLLLGLAGGLGGVLLGLLAAQAVGWGTAWKTEISLLPAALALVFSLAVGLVAGIVPAQRAAAVDPIEALRAK
jgi:putative ABC transport system permease protein